MFRALLIATGLACCALLTPPEAAAFDSSENTVAGYLTADEASRFSKEVERTLAERGARVAMVFRAGRPRSELPDGFSYTHGAFWVYQPALLPDGQTASGYSVYNLYSGDGKNLPKSRSHLVMDFPFDFISGSHEDDLAIIIPSSEVQRRLQNVIASPVYQALHVPEYSLISNPADARYQNCTEFMLDVLAAAIWQTDNYSQIKTNLGAYFQPAAVRDARGLKRLLAPVADPRLRTDDHSGKVRTATYETIAAFMQTHEYASESFIFSRTIGEGS